MMPGKGLDSILVKPSFEEAHVQSGHVLFWKALMNSMKGCRTLFRKCRICSWKLHSCLFNIKYIFFEKHKLLWKNKWICQIMCVCIHGNMYNNIMQNSFFIESWAFGPHVMPWNSTARHHNLWSPMYISQNFRDSWILNIFHGQKMSRACFPVTCCMFLQVAQSGSNAAEAGVS